jgi:hypothetical protein
MIKIINPKRLSYHSAVVEEFNDLSRPSTAGIAYGFSSEKYSWVADFLFKHENNTFINKHSCYISFFSDKEIMFQEYGNVEELGDQYPFFLNYERLQYSPHTFELTTKQYKSVSQNYSEFDLVELVNESGLIVDSTPGNGETILSGCISEYNIDNDGSGYELYDLLTVDGGAILEISSIGPDGDVWGASLKYHGTEYVVGPTVYETTGGSGSGCTITVSKIEDVVRITHWLGRLPMYKAVGFKYDMDKESYSYEGYNRYVWSNDSNFLYQISDDYSTIYLPLSENIDTGSVGDAIRDRFLSSYPSYMNRIVDYKMSVDKQPVVVMTDSKYEYNDIVCGTDNYDPQNPFVSFVRSSDWYGVHPFTNLDSNNDVLTFYPEIKDSGRVVPKKIYSYFTTPPQDDSVKLLRNPGVHLKEFDDQSRLSYSVCKHMVYYDDGPFVIKTMDPINQFDVMLEGIDIDTERNRKHSAVVTTQPHMIVRPLMDGQIVEIAFVDVNRSPIVEPESMTMFLEVKAPYSYIKDLDRKLNEREYNTDIIHTVTIKNPNSSLFNSSYGFYNTFSNLNTRQDACLDDLIGGVVGTGVKKSFWITDLASTGFYTDDKMKVAGMGFGSEPSFDFINIYCSNYTPESSYAPGDVDRVPIPNSTSKLCEYTSYDGVQNGELFRPMIKLPGINGYIKILKRNDSFKMTKAVDGDHLVVYNIEFPFCPGSYSERIAMNFSGGHKRTQVYFKQSYINAGSHKLHDGGVYDSDNDRHSFQGDDSFTCASLNLIPTTYNDIDYDGFLYPEHLVYHEKKFDFLSLIRPSDNSFLDFGTYVAELQNDGGPVENAYNHDIRINFLSDNRVWKFGNRYSSYIDRENPSYVMDVDTSTLLEDFDQKEFIGVPDKKKWLYTYFSGIMNNTESDIVLEMWDGSNWGPISVISSDTEKILGKVVWDNLFISSDGIVDEQGDITSFVVGNADFVDGDLNLPTEVLNSVGLLTNGVLTNSFNKTSYHIIFAEHVQPGGIEMIKLYVKKDRATLDSELLTSTIVVDITDPPDEYVSYLSFGEPKYVVNDTFSNIKYENQYVTKYLDIDDIGSGVSFRARVARKKEFPASVDHMQYIGQNAISEYPYGNTPWWNGASYDTAFSYKKNNLQDYINKFGMIYFKTASK